MESRGVWAWGLVLVAVSALGAEPVFDVSRMDEPAAAETVAEALARVEQALKGQPDDAALLARRGELRFKQHDFAGAVANFSAAISRNARLDEAWFGRGMALGRDGQVAEGIRDLDVYLARHPRSSLAYTKRGVRYLWLGDLDRAARDFERALEFDPRNAEAHDDLGVVHAQQGQYETAERHFRSALSVDPTYQKAHHNLAMVRYITGQQDHALSSVEKSLQMAPQARDSLLLKAMILEAMGRVSEARAIREAAEFLSVGESSSRMTVR